VGRAITGIVGLNGAGKSLCAMERYARVALLQGRFVLCNVPLFPERLWPDGWNGKARIGSTGLLTSLEQLSSVERGTLIIIDDVAAVFPARDWKSMPAGIHTKLQTLRHLGAQLVWTAPTWERVDLTIREVTQEVVSCKSFWTAGGLWGHSRFVIWKTWEVSRYLSGQPSKTPGRVRFVPFIKGRLLYDTESVIDPFIHLDSEGVCTACGGRRTRPSCKCADNAASHRPEAVVGLRSERVPMLTRGKHESS